MIGGLFIRAPLARLVRPQQRRRIGLESEVVVVSAAPIIAVENTKLATNIDAEELKDLPVSRSVSSIFPTQSSISFISP